MAVPTEALRASVPEPTVPRTTQRCRALKDTGAVLSRHAASAQNSAAGSCRRYGDGKISNVPRAEFIAGFLLSERKPPRRGPGVRRAAVAALQLHQQQRPARGASARGPIRQTKA